MGLCWKTGIPLSAATWKASRTVQPKPAEGQSIAMRFIKISVQGHEGDLSSPTGSIRKD